MHTTILAIALLFYPFAAHAALTCAARPLAKPDLQQFLSAFSNTINETEIYRRASARTFNSKYGHVSDFEFTAREFYEKDYSPQDVVCIADETETVESLRKANIWQTHSGTTVLLSEYSAEEVNPVPSHMFGSGTYPIVKRLIVSDALEHTDYSHCDSRVPGESGPDPLCVAEEKRRFDNRIAELESNLTESHFGAKSSTFFFTYRANNGDHYTHEGVFQQFVIAVAALEAANIALYSRPQTPENYSRPPNSKIFDPLTKRNYLATSLVGFIGDHLREWAVDEIFRKNFSLITEFPLSQFPRGLPVPTISIPKSSMTQTSLGDTSESGLLDQIARSFLCNQTGQLTFETSRYDPLTIFRTYRDLSCSTTTFVDKEVIDYGSILTLDLKLDDDLDLAKADDMRNLLDARLNELAAIELQQSRTLERLHEYAARSYYDSVLRNLSDNLEALEDMELSFPEGVIKVGVAMALIPGGGAEFIGGVKDVMDLTKEMPTGSWPDAIGYFVEHKEKYSSANSRVSKGAAHLTQGINALRAIIRSGQVSGDIARLREEIANVERQRNRLIQEIHESIGEIETEWMRKLEEVYDAERNLQSTRGIVALHLEKIIGGNILFGFSQNDLHDRMTGCGDSLKAFREIRNYTNMSPVNVRCGGISEELDRIQVCVRKAEMSEEEFTGIETEHYVLLFTTNRQAIHCF